MNRRRRVARDHAPHRRIGRVGVGWLVMSAVDDLIHLWTNRRPSS